MRLANDLGDAGKDYKKGLLTSTLLESQQMTLDRLVRNLEDIRDSYQMDNLRSQHMDKLESNDEGW